MVRIFLTLIAFIYSSLLFGDTFLPTASYQVCFTPEQQCTDVIVTALNQSKKEILVQAYSFTSAPIAKALIQAKKRGVDVKVILDKSQSKHHGFCSAKYLTDYHVATLIDYKPSIAHNKVMIIDQQKVVTGSFNFTRAAQERNAENVIIINDKELARKYIANWQQRAQESSTFESESSPFD